MAIKLNEKTKFWIVYGKYKDSDGVLKNYKKQTKIKSKKDAIAFDLSFKKEKESQVVIQEGATLFGLVDLYLNTRNFAINTIANYTKTKNVIKNDVALNQLNTKFIQENFIPKFNVEHVKNLKCILKFGYKMRLIKEPLHQFVIFKNTRSKKEIKLFDKNRIVEDRNHRFQNGVELNDLISFALETGYRISEMLSIRFTDIRKDHILLKEQLLYDPVKKEYIWSPLKTENSVRKIPITKKARDIIDKQPFIKEGFLFGGVEFIRPGTVQDCFKKKYGAVFHSLRHTHASYLIEYSYEVLGYCDKDNIAKHMGHSVQMLENTYKHLFRDKKGEILQVLEYINEKD